MGENGRISARQYMILVILFAIGSTILVAPSALAASAKQDAWISVLIGTVAGTLLVLLYARVASLAPSLTMVELTERVLGKWGGKAVSLWFLATSFEGAAFMLGFLGNFLTTQIMPETPPQALNITFMLLAVYGVRMGVEAMARAAELLFVPFIVLFIAMVILVLPQAHPENLQPIFETGAKPLMRSVLAYVSLSSLTLIVMSMVFPACGKSRKQARNAFLWGNVWSGCLMLVLVLVTILVLGVEETTRKVYPSYVLAQKINIGEAISRIEIVVALLWFITLYYKLTFYFYAVAVGLAQTLGLKEYRVLTYPLGVLCVILASVISPNPLYERIYIEKTWIFYIATSGLLWPILLLCIAPFRKKQLAEQKEEASTS